MAISATDALRAAGPRPPAQRAAPTSRPRVGAQAAPRFSVVVLARPDSAMAAAADAALRAVGALDVRYASSPADLLRAIPIPEEVGLGVICRSMHELPVVQLVAQLRQRGWRRLIIVCGDRDETAVRTAIAMKVRCFIRRPDAVEHPPASAAVSTTVTPSLTDLSAREVQVLQAVADGHTNNEIGELLGLSGLTVKSHLARIGRKAGTGDRAEMVARGLRAGLLH
jgi:DNA-binding NarL/FixJ family response regulator